MRNPLTAEMMRALLIVGVLLTYLLLTACAKAPSTPLPTPTPQVTVALDEAAAVLQQIAVPELNLSVALAAVVGDTTSLDSLLVDMAHIERLALEEQIPEVPVY